VTFSFLFSQSDAKRKQLMRRRNRLMQKATNSERSEASAGAESRCVLGESLRPLRFKIFLCRLPTTLPGCVSGSMLPHDEPDAIPEKCH